MIIKNMSLKHLFVRVALTIEIIIVIGFLVFGAQGFTVVQALKNEVMHGKQAIALRELEIKKLEAEQSAWENDLFYVEKYAREKLSMARDGETIYVIK